MEDKDNNNIDRPSTRYEGTVKCTGCGRRVKEDDEYCPHCGVDLSQGAPDFRMIIAVIIILLGAVVFFGSLQ